MYTGSSSIIFNPEVDLTELNNSLSYTYATAPQTDML
jgi:hypothetical protein